MLKYLKNTKLHIVIIIFLVGFFLGLNMSGLVKAEEPIHQYLDYFHQVYQTIKTSYVDVPDNKNIFYGAIRGMIAALNDPYSRFLDEDAFSTLKEDTTGKFVGIGVEITIKDGQIVVISPIEDTPAMKAGILSEDVIIKVDDVPTKDKELADIIKLIKGVPHSKVKVTIKREGFDDPIDFVVERVPIKKETVYYGIIKESPGTGYIKATLFSGETSKDIEDGLVYFNKNNISKLIVDMRWNPGGLLDKAITISNMFLPKDKLIVSTKGRDGTGDVQEYRSEIEPLYKGNLLVLVNNGSASASEIFAAAMRDNGRGKLLGTKTFGKGSVQKVFNIDENIGVSLTIAKYYTPSGVSIHGKGIVPDYVVKPAEISKEDTENILTIYKRKLLEKFEKDNKEYNAETRKKFRELLKSENLTISDKSSDMILKRDINKYSKNPVYDLEFDNQLEEAVKIINKL